MSDSITQRPTLSEPGLLFMDMDSTLIQCECIDEIADFLGIKAQISAITERAMRGELDFAASLTERVQLLAGLDASVLEKVYQECIELTDGAEELISTVQQHGWKVGLVSGGFTYFTDKLQARLNLDFTRSNVLEIHNNKLTGGIIGDIIDADCKRRCLQEQADIFSIPMRQTVAIGDGANDLPMIHAAGLGIAFHAKPTVQEQADVAINQGGLEQVLTFLRP
ncbi:MAG: phosphoserine phosphatase SerB [Flavobacteriaceae bacterium]|nr:MAG: phosphoserine phosphatase SerB [Flavobacteriaceae bacterium]